MQANRQIIIGVAVATGRAQAHLLTGDTRTAHTHNTLQRTREAAAYRYTSRVLTQTPRKAERLRVPLMMARVHSYHTHRQC